jgi:hypothetical protein
MKKQKRAILILILILISLLSNVFAQKNTIHIITAPNKFGKYDNASGTSIYEYVNNSEINVYLTKDTIYIVDTGNGVIMLSDIEYAGRDTSTTAEYIILITKDHSDTSDVKNCLFLIGRDLATNERAIYFTNYDKACFLNIIKTTNDIDFTIGKFIASLPKYEEPQNTKSP